MRAFVRTIVPSVLQSLIRAVVRIPCALFFVVLLLVLYSPIAFAETQAEAQAETQAEAQAQDIRALVEKVQRNSIGFLQNNLALQIALKKEQFDKNSLLIPSFNFSVFPLQPSYQSVQTFVPSYTVNPINPTAPLIFSGLSPFRLATETNNLGLKLDLKSPTPFGGYTAIELQDFLLFSRDFTKVDQDIFFLWTFNQPLFVNNSLITTNPLRVKLAQIRNERRLNEIAHKRSTNEIILGAYQDVLETLSLQKQLAVLTNALALLDDNLKVLEVQFEKGSVGNKTLLSLKSSIALKEKEKIYLIEALRIKKLQLIRQGSLDISDLDSFTISSELPSFDIPVLNSFDASTNPRVSNAAIGLEDAQNQLILQDVNGKPSMNLSLSVQPRYAPERVSSNFWDSFSDLGDDDASVDVMFSIEFVFPLLSSYTRKPLAELQNLLIENRRLELEKHIDSVKETNLEYHNTINSLQFEREKLLIDIELQNILLAEELIKNERQASTSLLMRQQELSLAEKELELWEIEKNILFSTLLLLANMGKALDEL